MKISELIEATNSRWLYHFTHINNLILIIDSNVLYGETKQQIKGRWVRGVSLTENPELDNFGDVRFRLDVSRLERRRLVPFDEIEAYEPLDDEGLVDELDPTEEEVFHKGDITNLMRRVDEVYINLYRRQIHRDIIEALEDSAFPYKTRDDGRST